MDFKEKRVFNKFENLLDELNLAKWHENLKKSKDVNMTEDNKLKLFTEDIKIIQEIIKRMAENSFKIKDWTIRLIVIAIVFRAKIDSVFVAFVPLLAFSYLDAYYLMFERRFRKLYNTKIYNFKKG